MVELRFAARGGRKPLARPLSRAKAEMVRVRFEGADSEIDIQRPAGGKHTPEFEAWRWERIDALPELVVPFKRKVYEKVVSTFISLSKPALSA